MYEAMAVARRFMCSLPGIDTSHEFDPPHGSILAGLGYAALDLHCLCNSMLMTLIDTLLEAVKTVDPLCDYVDINLGLQVSLLYREARKLWCFLHGNLPLVINQLTIVYDLSSWVLFNRAMLMEKGTNYFPE